MVFRRLQAIRVLLPPADYTKSTKFLASIANERLEVVIIAYLDNKNWGRLPWVMLFFLFLCVFIVLSLSLFMISLVQKERLNLYQNEINPEKIKKETI